jgi:hypothetical protein
MSSVQDCFNSFLKGYSDMDKTMIVFLGASWPFDSSMIQRTRLHNTKRGHFRVALKGTY